jgi:hypothetical protein
MREQDDRLSVPNTAGPDAFAIRDDGARVQGSVQTAAKMEIPSTEEASAYLE